jgi:outer membrane receptor protein involved in Fe transport
LYRPPRGAGRTVQQSNPELDPERLRGAELGVRLDPTADLWLDLAAYWSLVDDPIVIRTVAFAGPSAAVIAPCGAVPANGVCRVRDNLGQIRSRGLEFTFGWSPTREWTIDGNYAYRDAVITDAPGEGALVGNSVKSVPGDTASLGVTWSSPAWFTAHAQGRYYGERFQDDLNLFPLEEHFLVDLLLSRDLSDSWAVYLSGRNVLDESYDVSRDAGNHDLGSPRRLAAGVRLRWNGS